MIVRGTRLRARETALCVAVAGLQVQRFRVLHDGAVVVLLELRVAAHARGRCGRAATRDEREQERGGCQCGLSAMNR